MSFDNFFRQLERSEIPKQRILIAVPVEKGSPEPITIVLNWTAEVKR